jgi:hypothetical protein
MKTERRHELQTNALAESLARWIEAIRPYNRVITAVLIAVIVAVCAWGYLAAQNTRRLEDGWTEFFDATAGRNPNPDELLRDIATRYSGTMVAHWARLTLADVQLENGTSRLLQDRRAAREELREASEKFQALLAESPPATIQERATYGLARAHEALGELDRARGEYRTLAEKWPAGPFAATARARASDLERLPAKTFYDWLAKYEPPPPLTGELGKPGERPDFLKEPDEGNILKLPGLAEPASAPELPTVSPAGETPRSEGTPKASDDKKPVEPTADKPSAPSDEKPVEPQPPDQSPTKSAADEPK